MTILHNLNCYNIDGKYYDNTGLYKGSWTLINNTFSHIYIGNGTTYTGIYSNGIIRGTMIGGNDGAEGCFTLVKQ